MFCSYNFSLCIKSLFQLSLRSTYIFVTLILAIFIIHVIFMINFLFLLFQSIYLFIKLAYFLKNLLDFQLLFFNYFDQKMIDWQRYFKFIFVEVLFPLFLLNLSLLWIILKNVHVVFYRFYLVTDYFLILFSLKRIFVKV